MRLQAPMAARSAGTSPLPSTTAVDDPITDRSQSCNCYYEYEYILDQVLVQHRNRCGVSPQNHIDAHLILDTGTWGCHRAAEKVLMLPRLTSASPVPMLGWLNASPPASHVSLVPAADIKDNLVRSRQLDMLEV